MRVVKVKVNEVGLVAPSFWLVLSFVPLKSSGLILLENNVLLI
jgi:hypothetical protein